MKILNVNHLLDAKTGGGTAERTMQLSRFFQKADMHSTVLTLDIGLAPERVAALGGAAVIALRCVYLRYFVPWFSYRELRQLIAQNDIVQLTGHWTLLNALMFWICKRAKKTYVFCPAGALSPFGRSILIKQLYDLLVGRKIAREASMCIAVTELERTDFLRYGVPPERVIVIDNGVDPEQYANPSDADSQQTFRNAHALGDMPYVLFLGRLNLIKGPDLLLDAFAEVAVDFPTMHLVFAGPDGGMLSDLKDAAENRGIAGKLRFVGYIQGTEKNAALRSAALLAIPSRREAMSIVVLEAGICETPVLFTDQCGLDEIARAGAGTMTEASAHGLAVGLKEMLRDMPGNRRRADQLKKMVLERFTWEKQASRYLALFENLTKRRQ